jgi:hypothetical protein
MDSLLVNSLKAQKSAGGILDWGRGRCGGGRDLGSSYLRLASASFRSSAFDNSIDVRSRKPDDRKRKG